MYATNQLKLQEMYSRAILFITCERQHNLYVGDRTAEKIKIHVGSATEELDNPPEDYPVQGRDLMTGKPKQITVSSGEIAKALNKSIIQVEDAVMQHSL